MLQGSGATADLKLADFGLSALVRLDEFGYDAEESSKRKNYNHLKDVRTFHMRCLVARFKVIVINML